MFNTDRLSDILHHIILHYILYYIILYILFYIILYYIILKCSQVNMHLNQESEKYFNHGENQTQGRDILSKQYYQVMYTCSFKTILRDMKN